MSTEYTGSFFHNDSSRRYVKKFVLFKQVTSGEWVFFGNVYHIVSRWVVEERKWEREGFGIFTEEEFLIRQLTDPLLQLSIA